jgi:diguanylate cyclase (GGDEF)-like protein
LRDQLRGLPNLQHLSWFVAAEMARKGTHAALSLIFVDLQPLQTTNHRLGAELRDLVLAKVIECIRRVLRGADVLFSYGSDELVVLLTHTEREAAGSVARRISDKISEQTIPNAGDSGVGVAIGVAAAPEDGVTAEELVTIARRSERITTTKPEHHPPSVH